MVHSILVANPKGGSGKSTLATNLAAYYAGRGLNVMLGDVDRQQTSRVWLSRRPESCPRIGSWDLAPGEPARPPRGTRVMILDSAAGLHGKKLTALLRRVDHVLVPIQPSPFDMWASEAFFQDLLAEKALRKSRVFMGVVGMRVDSRTRSARELEQFWGGCVTHRCMYRRPLMAWACLICRRHALSATVRNGSRSCAGLMRVLIWIGVISNYFSIGYGLNS